MHNKKVISVLSGKGGVGKTTIAVGIARALDAGILDVDVMAPNVPEILDHEIEREMTSTDRGIIPAIQDGVEVVSLKYELPDNTVFMRGGDFKVEMLKEYIARSKWESDTVVVDTPPGSGEESRTVLSTLPETKAVVVATGQDVSIIDCKRTIRMLNKSDRQIIGVIENMNEYVTDEGEHLPLFGTNNIEEDFDVLVLGKVPFYLDEEDREERIAEIVDKSIKEVL